MADVTTSTYGLGNSLLSILNCEEILPGSDPSYQACKAIYLYHPLGAKIAESPVAIAQSQEREISVPLSPGSRVVDAFRAKWKEIKADQHIFNCRKLSRVYGISTLALRARGVPTEGLIDPFDLPNHELAFVVFDPLNTSGSLINNQNIRDFDFMQVYIAYTSSAFGFTGRSSYQRALFPLKTFLQSMITDDMVTQKAGLLIAKQRQPGSIIDNVMMGLAGIKRTMLQGGRTGNVLSIATDEAIETLNMMNIDGAAGWSRENILKNIATGADMPASMLNQETMAEGFGEGTEDAKNIARYVDRERVTMAPLYDWFDEITMHLAWTPEFYATLQRDLPSIYPKRRKYEAVFYEWKNSFKAEWPSLLIEPESEQSKTADVKLKAAIAIAEVLLPIADPENKATIAGWLADSANDDKILFQSPLTLDLEAMANYEPPAPPTEPDEPKPEGATT